VLGYDLCVLSIATAFLVKDGLSRGFLPGERVVMLVCWAGLIFMMAPAIPIAICVALLILIARRILAYRQEPTDGWLLRPDGLTGQTVSSGGSGALLIVPQTQPSDGARPVTNYSEMKPLAGN